MYVLQQEMDNSQIFCIIGYVHLHASVAMTISVQDELMEVLWGVANDGHDTNIYLVTPT
jgi:hypothetical protein